MAKKRETVNDRIKRAQRLGGYKTKEEAVTAALEGYIRRHQQLRVLEQMGTIDYDPDYDYKKGRRRRHIEYLKRK
jgi:Bacterial antitoxin of type II TA system, VapB